MLGLLVSGMHFNMKRQERLRLHCIYFTFLLQSILRSDGGTKGKESDMNIVLWVFLILGLLYGYWRNPMIRKKGIWIYTGWILMTGALGLFSLDERLAMVMVVILVLFGYIFQLVEVKQRSGQLTIRKEKER